MANNRLVLHHRPTGNHIALGKRMGNGWYTNRSTDVDMAAFYDKCDTDLASMGLDVFEHQDDFELLIEDNTHAPMLASNFRWEPSPESDERYRIVKIPEAFKEGDVVTLKSGGDKMTVRESVHGFVVCDWFDADHDLHRERFSPDRLTLCETDNAP